MGKCAKRWESVIKVMIRLYGKSYFDPESKSVFVGGGGKSDFKWLFVRTKTSHNKLSKLSFPVNKFSSPPMLDVR